MKDVYICRECGFVSTLRSEFRKIMVIADSGNNTIVYECKDCEEHKQVQTAEPGKGSEG